MGGPPKKVVFGDAPLDVLGLGVRARNALYRNSIRTVSDLLLLRDEGEGYLYAVRGLGEKGVAEIHAALARVTVDFEPAPSVPDPAEIPVYADRHGLVTPESSIAELGLGVRVHNALHRAGTRTVGALLQRRDEGEEALFAVRNMGEKGVAEVKAALDRFEVIATQSLPAEPTPVEPRVQTVYLISPEVIAWQAYLVLRQIEAGTLHHEALYQGYTLAHWLSRSRQEKPDRMFLVFANILGGALTCCDELEQLFQAPTRRGRDSARDLLILTERFDPAGGQTLQQIAARLDISRERVRQLQNQIQQTMMLRTSADSATLRIQSALLRARDMGSTLTWARWREDILTSGLCGRWQTTTLSRYDPSALLLALCNMVGAARPWLALPETLCLALQLQAAGRPKTLVHELLFERSIPLETRRLIRRQRQHSGAADAAWLAGELAIPRDEVEAVLQALGYEPLADTWYYRPAAEAAPSKSEVFHNNLRKMFKFCGPLDEADLYGGLRHALSRGEFPVPPPHILRKLLRLCGYAEQDGRFLFDGPNPAQLNESERIIYDCIRDRGPVVNYAELVAAFENSALSHASLPVRLQNSPLFDKVKTGRYHLRGSLRTLTDLQRAHTTDEPE